MNQEDKKNVSFLIKRLLRECQNSKGYIGVEYDNLEIGKDCPTLTEHLFHKIMNEINVLCSDSVHEYIIDEWNEEAPFRTLKNARQQANRLGKFVCKYAPIYLTTEKGEEFTKEIKSYVNV